MRSARSSPASPTWSSSPPARPRPPRSSARPPPRASPGQFIGLGPTWNPALLATPAAPALEALYLQSGHWGPFGTDTPGHQAMRDALGDARTPSDGYTAGWAGPTRSRPRSRSGSTATTTRTVRDCIEAVQSLETVDYEGMLPEEAGNRSGEPEREHLPGERDQQGRPGGTDGGEHRPGLLRRPDRRGVRVRRRLLRGLIGRRTAPGMTDSKGSCKRAALSAALARRRREDRLGVFRVSATPPAWMLSVA